MDTVNGFLPAVVALAVLSGTTSAQVPWTVVQGELGESFGNAVCGAGDVDHDGTPDWAAGAPFASSGMTGNYGRVRIHSGRTGALLRTYDGTSPAQQFGRAVANAGDVDADGWPDLVVGATTAYYSTNPPGLARVFSGRNGSLLYEFHGPANEPSFGFAVAGVGDVNGDGRADIAVGAPGSTTIGAFAGKVFVYSGLDGSTLFVLQQPMQGELFGYAIAGGRDLDHDGRPDFVVSAVGSGGTTGFVRAFSGASGAILFTTNGQVTGHSFGSSLDFCGDVDHDGTEDIVAGSNSGYATIVSGASGAILLSITGPTADLFGWAVCGPGDLDGDGTPDVVVGAAYSDAAGFNWGSVRVHSGQQGALIGAVSDSGASNPWQPLLGWSVAAVADVNGDGVNDFVAGAPGVSIVRVILGGCPPIHAYCTAKTNSLGCIPQATSSGSPSITTGGVTVGASNVLSHAPGMLFWGTQPAAIPFGGGTLCATGSPIVRTPIQSSGGTSACTGSYTFQFTRAYMIAKGLAPGSRVCAQFYSRDNGFPFPQNIGLTDAIEFIVCP